MSIPKMLAQAQTGEKKDQADALRAAHTKLARTVSLIMHQPGEDMPELSDAMARMVVPCMWKALPEEQYARLVSHF